VSHLLFTGTAEAQAAGGVDMPVAQHITQITSGLEMFSFVMHTMIFFNKVN
jgi:hypothetical protein